jgi:hypothetical protein
MNLPPSWRTGSLLAMSLMVVLVAGCSGSSSSGKAAPGASTTPTVSPTPVSSAALAAGVVKAKAACHAVTALRPVKGNSVKAEIAYLKRAAAAFQKSADLATEAAAQDPAWTTLEDAAKVEARAWAILYQGAANGVDKRATSQNAANAASSARPVFIAQCGYADPSLRPSGSPSATATANR